MKPQINAKVAIKIVDLVKDLDNIFETKTLDTHTEFLFYNASAALKKIIEISEVTKWRLRILTG